MKSYATGSLFLGALLMMVLPAASCQVKWTVPQLEYLSWNTDQIGNGNTALSKAEKTELRQVTGRAIRECLRDPGPGEPTTFAGSFNQLRVKRVSLSSAGVSGLIVQGMGSCMCGATGNCDFWLIAERPGGYSVVLQTIGIEGFQIKRTTLNGYFNVILGMHDSATDTDLSLYHYTGTYYRRVGCALMSYLGPHWTVLKSPKIKPRPCN